MLILPPPLAITGSHVTLSASGPVCGGVWPEPVLLQMSLPCTVWPGFIREGRPENCAESVAGATVRLCRPRLTVWFNPVPSNVNEVVLLSVQGISADSIGPGVPGGTPIAVGPGCTSVVAVGVTV